MFFWKRIKDLEKKVRDLDRTITKERAGLFFRVFEKKEHTTIMCSGVYHRYKDIFLREVIYLILEELNMELVYEKDKKPKYVSKEISLKEKEKDNGK